MPERAPLLSLGGDDAPRMTLALATLCVIDLLGVLPIITLPRNIAECGWIGIPLTLGVFALQVHTALLLGRCWIIAEAIHPDIAYTSRYPYAALSELSFGRRFGKFVTVLLDVTVLGNAVPNLIVAAQNLQLLGLKSSAWEFDFSYCYWVLILGICMCPITWVGTPRDIKVVTTVSVVMVGVAAVLVWACLLATGAAWRPSPLPAPAWSSASITYGVLAFQFDIHPYILSVQMDMKHKDKLGYAIVGAFIVTGGVSLATTALVLGRYGASARANLFQGFPPNILLYMALFLSTAQLCLALVLSAAHCFNDLEDKLGMPQGFGWRRALLRSALVGAAVLVAQVVPRFDLLMGLVGGALMGPLMFLLPPLLYARLRTMRERARHVPALDYAVSEGGDADADAEPEAEASTSSQPEAPAAGAPHRGWLREAATRLLSVEGAADEGPLSVWEAALTGGVVLAGVAASLSATYFSVSDTIVVAKFAPPCI